MVSGMDIIALFETGNNNLGQTDESNDLHLNY